jgi:hypothetical protein
MDLEPKNYLKNLMEILNEHPVSLGIHPYPLG